MRRFGHEGVGNAHGEGVGNAEGLGFCRNLSSVLRLQLLLSLLLVLLDLLKNRGGGIQSLLKELLMLLGSQSLVEGRLERARGGTRCHGGRGETKILGGPATHGGEVGRRGRGRARGSYLAAIVVAVGVGKIVAKVGGARRSELFGRNDEGVKVGAEMIAEGVDRWGPRGSTVVGIVVVVGVVHGGGISVEAGLRYDGDAGFALAAVLGRR